MLVLRILSWLPYNAGMRLTRGIGFILGKLNSRRKHVTETNLRLCFPEMDPRERDALTDEHLKQVGSIIYETAVFHFGSDKKIAKRMKIHGLQNLIEAQQKGKGVILLGGHFVAMEIAILGLHIVMTSKQLDIPIYPVYLVNNNPLLEHLITGVREKRVGTGIDNNNIKYMLQKLKEGGIVWYAPDQAFLSKSAVDVPFFATPAWSHTSTSRLAKISHAAVVPFFMAREEDGTYNLSILPALDNFPTADAARDVRTYHELIEKQVLKYPAQYLWIHRRFKRPGHLPDPYQKSD